MPYVAKRTRRNDAEFGGIHNLDVPMLTESADDPPTNRVGDEKERKRNRGEDGKKRPVKKNDFRGGSDENESVQQNHPAEFRVGDFRSAVGDDLFLMALGDLQLDDAQGSDSEQQSEKRDDV